MAVLQETAAISVDCAYTVYTNFEVIVEAYENQQYFFASSSIGQMAACQQFILSYLTLYLTVINTELHLMKHQATWDGLVCLLCGDLFFTMFDFEEIDEPSDILFNVLPAAIHSWPLQLQLFFCKSKVLQLHYHIPHLNCIQQLAIYCVSQYSSYKCQALFFLQYVCLLLSLRSPAACSTATGLLSHTSCVSHACTFYPLIFIYSGLQNPCNVWKF